MKKLELKNLTVKKLNKEELATVKGGNIPAQTSGQCNQDSVWPVKCTSRAWNCTTN
ncbi:hypothetical protein D3C87_2172060 [compost metagenome]|jgi:natural product precursor|uniref:TIGR04149 family rSAM-modified RiPP n=1 Tax=Flavobacterium sp. CFBP9031 TaxID=3096538 RepID=UPI000F92E49B|nr:TIGR04149 family rSAM-modified RiPP [Flavobacterium sp. CFBP9031]MDY0986622.1 TIGR04149 family rSAM-modified RiPP [Flavobacterium sp. CFBP9031]